MLANKHRSWSINELAKHLLDNQIINGENSNRKHAFKIAKKNLKLVNRYYRNNYKLEF